jgi:hypothetical protein
LILIGLIFDLFEEAYNFNQEVFFLDHLENTKDFSSMIIFIKFIKFFIHKYLIAEIIFRFS